MDIVITVIILFIILFVIFYTLRYSYLVNKKYGIISKALTNTIRKANEQDAIAALVQYFHNQNKDNNALYDLWRNYEKKIQHNDKTDTYYSYCHPREFFNRENLLNKNLEKRDFIKALPSIITSVGLAGTFTAILLGLVGINPSDMETINLLIYGLWGKFLSSIVALLCSILFVRNERLKYSDLNDKCIALQEALIKLIPVKTDTDILLSIQRNLNGQSKALQETLSKFQENSLEGVGQMVENMNNALGQLQNQSLKGVTDMVRKFEKVLSESSAEHFERIGNVVNDLSEVINDIYDAHNNYMENMESIRTTSQQAFENQKQLVESIQDTINTIKKESDSLANLLNGKNGELLDRIASDLAYAGEKFNDAVPTLIQTNTSIKELTENLNKSIEHFKEITEQIADDKYLPVIEKLRAEITAIIEQVGNTFVEAQDYFDTIPNSMAEIVQEQISKISQAMNSYSQETNKFLTEYDKNMATAVNMLHTNIADTEVAFSNNIDRLNNNFNKLNKTLETVNTKINGEH